MKTLRQYLLLLSAFALGNAELSASEKSEWFNDNRLEGFVSLSAMYSSDYNFMSESDDNVSADMWEAGALFSTRVYEQLRFSGQLLGRKVSEESGGDLRIDYAFFSLPLYTSMENQVSMRLGRIRSSYGFYNETRDIPHTRTGIIMPQSIYYDVTRNSLFAADGIELITSHEVYGQPLTFQAFFSKPVADDEELKERSDLNPSNLKGDKSLMVKLSYGSEFEGWRAALTYYRPEYTLDVNPVLSFDSSAIGLPPGSTINAQIYGDDSSLTSEAVLSSLEYNQIDWAITTEYSRSKIKSQVNVDLNQTLSGLIFTPTPTQVNALQVLAADNIKYLGYEESFYIQGLYRWDEQFESYLRYDSNRLRESSFADPTGHWVDINIGSTWRPDSNWLVRGELHYIDGWSRLFNRDNTGTRNNRYWHAAALQVAYRW
jgi:hypothetical protein